jgi:hypothetical protein
MSREGSQRPSGRSAVPRWTIAFDAPGLRPQLMRDPLDCNHKSAEPMDPVIVDGHRVVLILIQVDEAGEVLDDQHAMRTGEAHWDGETLWLDWGQAEPPYALDQDWLARIQRLSPGVLAEETGASFSLMLKVGPLAEGGEQSGEYRPLGWKWPDPPDSTE